MARALGSLSVLFFLTASCEQATKWGQSAYDQLTQQQSSSGPAGNEQQDQALRQGRSVETVSSSRFRMPANSFQPRVGVEQHCFFPPDALSVGQENEDKSGQTVTDVESSSGRMIAGRPRQVVCASLSSSDQDRPVWLEFVESLIPTKDSPQTLQLTFAGAAKPYLVYPASTLDQPTQVAGYLPADQWLLPAPVSAGRAGESLQNEEGFDLQDQLQMQDELADSAQEMKKGLDSSIDQTIQHLQQPLDQNSQNSQDQSSKVDSIRNDYMRNDNMPNESDREKGPSLAQQRRSRTQPSLADIEGSSYRTAIEQAVSEGWAPAFSDGRFLPDSPITWRAAWQSALATWTLTVGVDIARQISPAEVLKPLKSFARLASNAPQRLSTRPDGAGAKNKASANGAASANQSGKNQTGKAHWTEFAEKHPTYWLLRSQATISRAAYIKLWRSMSQLMSPPSLSRRYNDCLNVATKRFAQRSPAKQSVKREVGADFQVRLMSCLQR